jgi:chromosome segregation ATPase
LDDEEVNMPVTTNCLEKISRAFNLVSMLRKENGLFVEKIEDLKFANKENLTCYAITDLVGEKTYELRTAIENQNKCIIHLQNKLNDDINSEDEEKSEKKSKRIYLKIVQEKMKSLQQEKNDLEFEIEKYEDEMQNQKTEIIALQQRIKLLEDKLQLYEMINVTGVKRNLRNI